MTKDIEKFESRKHPENAVVVQDNGPSAIVMMAMQKGYDPALIEKMMDLADRNDKNEARKAFVRDKAAFKAEAPTIYKDKDNKQYSSKYASEDSLINTATPILSKYGFDVSFKPDQSEGIKITCILTHKLGHSEEATMSGPPDKSGSKNELQQIKSTTTYLRKATFEAVTGLATTDKRSDDDGNAAGSEFITEEQRRELEKVIVEKGIDGEAFFKYMKVETTDTIPGKDFNKAMNALKKAKGQKVEA